MPPRRVIVHAGFHKTGTTSAQRYLLANGKHIWPRCALVMQGRLRTGTARMAARYSRFGTAALLQEFANDLHTILSGIDLANRNLLISDENLAGRMPGRDGQAGYDATPDLMKQLEAVVQDVFGTDTQIVFQFTTRARADWLNSTYKHNLLASRLTMDADTYHGAYGNAADLGAVVTAVAEQVNGRVLSSDLADLTGPAGPAQPLIDLMDLPAHLVRHHTPQPPSNTGPDDDLIDDLLALNRSALSDSALRAAKLALLGKALPDDG